MLPITIETKNSSKEELAQKKTLEEILEKYNCPIFTNEVLIETGSIPHSHPVLTLNTRNTDEFMILKTFIHEQFHWFTVLNEKYDECIEFLKKNHIDLGDCNKTGKYPNSFWEHLIVCWNTRNFLQNNTNRTDTDFIYNQWQAYPLTEKYVEENFEKLKIDLEKFSMVYEK